MHDRHLIKFRSILGPALGGALAQPCESYPSMFARDTIFDRFPFLLPNLVCTAILVCGVTIGILFLEETHEDRKHKRDLGLEAGRWISKHLKRRSKATLQSEKAETVNAEESDNLLQDDLPPGYRTTEGSPCLPSSPNQSAKVVACNQQQINHSAKGMPKAFSRQVILNIVGYGILA